MSKVIFIGGIWLEDEENTIISNSRGVVQIAANILQTNIIKGIEENIAAPVIIINEKFLGAYPFRYKKMIIKNSRFNHNISYDSEDYEVSFLNLPVIKHFSRYLNSKRFIRAACKTEEDTYVIGYSMSYSIVKGLLYAKKINPNVKTCLVIPDLPEFMNLGQGRGKLFDVIKSQSNRKLYKLIGGIDSFALLTKHMYTKIGTEKPFVVMEGIASFAEQTPVNNENNELIKNIVYTGTLDDKYGACDLVDAFHSIEGDNLRLIICGEGDGKTHIMSVAKQDARIKYMGTVTNKEAKEIQKKAFLLVNPRNNTEEYTKYSFPSKTMEYMASGRPVLMYKLQGIPDEYDNYLYYIEGNIRESIIKLLNTPDIIHNQLGKEAQEFVYTKKNAREQTKHILQMLYKIS